MRETKYKALLDFTTTISYDTPHIEHINREESGTQDRPLGDSRREWGASTSIEEEDLIKDEVNQSCTTSEMPTKLFREFIQVLVFPGNPTVTTRHQTLHLARK